MEQAQYYVDNQNRLIRKYKGSNMIFPFIKGSTYLKYQSSPSFMKTLNKAANTYIHRHKNERNQIILLSGKTKPITIKGRGTYNMPIEIFDRIISASKAAGIDPKQGLAIAIKESSGYTDPDRINTYHMSTSHIKGQWNSGSLENAAGPSTIVSNWQYFDNSPYIGLLKGWEDSGWDVNRMEEDGKYQYKRHLSDYDAWDKNIDEDILTNMFKLPLNRINSEEKDYPQVIKLYMNNMYYKFGGVLFLSSTSPIDTFRKRNIRLK